MNLILQTMEELKKETFNAVQKLSELRQREALVEIKSLLNAGYS